MQERILPL
uniref:Uncharacterized protein n=1 Tax=Rhizophora mucronata TaxID=61149 RepID=A0A2P2KGP6_RHIMU